VDTEVLLHGYLILHQIKHFFGHYFSRTLLSSGIKHFNVVAAQRSKTLSMALVMPAISSASSERDLGASELASSTATSSSLRHTVSSQSPLISGLSETAENQGLGSNLYLTQNQCAASIDIRPAQISGCDIPPKPTFKNDTVNAPDRGDIVARKRTLQSLRQIQRQFPLFQKAKSKWPDPDASVGKFCGMKGRFSCWEAKGPAQEAFSSLSKEIATLLERTCGPVPASSHVIYDIFMVGEIPGTAIPQVMFSCRKSGPRKEAMETLKKSGILGNYPGIESGHWQFPPHILDPRLLAYGVEPDSRAETATEKILLVPLYTSSSIISSSTSPETMSAMRLYTVDPSEMNGVLHKATVGSLASFAGKIFYLSVSHALVKSGACDIEPLLSTTEDDDDSEFEFGGLIDVVEDFGSPDGEESELNDSGSMIWEPSGSQDDSNHELTIDGSSESLNLVGSDISLRIPTEVSYSHNTNSFKDKSPELSPPTANITENQQSSADFATIFLESTDLDYALIEPSAEHNIMPALSGLPIISLGNIGKIPPGETSILTVTGSSGPAYGILSGRPSYIRLLSSRTFQEAYTAIIDGPLMPGDSGSIVLNAETRKVYGHMVVGSTVSRIAYIIPASDVLKDLRLREEANSHMKIEVEAHSIKSADSNEEVLQIPSELHLRPDSVPTMANSERNYPNFNQKSEGSNAHLGDRIRYGDVINQLRMVKLLCSSSTSPPLAESNPLGIVYFMPTDSRRRCFQE
jgi:hypothetical protein